jgi:SAM-dependent methyltransferase
MTFGSFIEPYQNAQDIAALEERLQSHIGCGFRSVSASRPLLGQNRIFDRIVARIETLDLDYEDQCSAQYYFDLVRTLRDFNGQFDRVVEVGVFMGGSTSYLAGCAEAFDFDIDLVDVSASYLRFAHERARRLYPEAAKRMRLFHGDLPTYVREVMRNEADRRSIVHHDGCHEFNQVVKDMASLYYVRQSLLAVIAQDTHLRGSARYLNFVDMALYAVFGMDLKFAPIGNVLGEHDPMTAPDAYHGNYFMAGVAEGVVLPMAANRFVYPHPAHAIEHLLPSEEELAKIDAVYGDNATMCWTAAEAA